MIIIDHYRKKIKGAFRRFKGRVQTIDKGAFRQMNDNVGRAASKSLQER